MVSGRSGRVGGSHAAGPAALDLRRAGVRGGRRVSRRRVPLCRRRAARRPGDLVPPRRRGRRDDCVLLALARARPRAQPLVPVRAGGVRRRADHDGRAHHRRSAERLHAAVRAAHRGAAAAREHGAGDVVRGARVFRRRVLRAPHGAERAGGVAGGGVRGGGGGDGVLCEPGEGDGGRARGAGGELRQVRLEAADVLRNIPTGVLTVDHEGRLLYCNPAAEQLLGLTERQWRGRPVTPELARIAPEFWAAITATARRGVRAMRVEATVRRPDRTVPIGVTTTTLEAGPGAAPRVTAIFTDISDSKRLEELRLRAERLEAV